MKKYITLLAIISVCFSSLTPYVIKNETTIPVQINSRIGGMFDPYPYILKPHEERMVERSAPVTFIVATPLEGKINTGSYLIDSWNMKLDAVFKITQQENQLKIEMVKN